MNHAVFNNVLSRQDDSIEETEKNHIFYKYMYTRKGLCILKASVVLSLAGPRMSDLSHVNV